MPPLLLYLLTLAPDITWAHNGADGGDLIVAAYSLGVSHPPGYPAYTLLAHFFTQIPWGSIAWRVNLLSALGAALAAGAAALSVAALTEEKPAFERFFGALAAAWLLAFSPALWSQALIAEVYAPHAALIGFSLWLALRLRARPSPSAALILGLLWGISFGFQMISIFLLPLLLWALWRAAAQARFFALGAALAALQWLYPALRAGQGAITWGSPASLTGWWWLVSGSLYQGYLFSAPPEIWLPRLLYLLRALLLDFGPFSAPLAFLGGVVLVRTRPRLALCLGASAVALIIFALGYNTSDSNNYLLPVFLFFCVLIGFGLTELWPRVRARLGRFALPLGSALFLALILWSLIVNGPRLSLRAEREAVQFGEKILQSAPPNAVLLTGDDRATFTLWYFRYVLHQREDVLVLDQDLLTFDWYRAPLNLSPEQVSALLAGNGFSPRPLCRVSLTPEPALTGCSDGY
ncbi:MAG: hypothetical protein OHK0031_05220 [Anaerolineales bacterium]